MKPPLREDNGMFVSLFPKSPDLKFPGIKRISKVNKKILAAKLIFLVSSIGTHPLDVALTNPP